MSPLTLALTQKSPREKAGAQTSAKYNFQWNFTLLKVIALHKTDTDYRILLEHFDDFVVLVPSNDPTTAESFQIKGKATGRWTANALSKAEKDATAPKSIVGRMYHNIDCLGEPLTRAHFVSNASYRMTLVGGQKTTPDYTSIRCDQLHDDDRIAITSAIDDDFPPPRLINHELKFVFETTELGLTGYETYVKGALVEFFSATGDNPPIVALYETLIATISARSSVSTEALTAAELFETKSLSRDDIQSTFDAALHTSRTVLDSWSLVEKDFSADGWSSLGIARLNANCLQYIRSRIRGDNIPAQLHAACLTASPGLAVGIGSAKTFREITNLLRPEVAQHESNFDAPLFDAALLVEGFEVWNAAR